MKTPKRRPSELLRLAFEALEERHSANELAEILGVHKGTASKFVRQLVADGLVAAVSERTAANRNVERVFQKKPGAVWPQPPMPKDFILPDPYMFRMVAVRPGVHA